MLSFSFLIIEQHADDTLISNFGKLTKPYDLNEKQIKSMQQILIIDLQNHQQHFILGSDNTECLLKKSEKLSSQRNRRFKKKPMTKLSVGGR